VLDNGRLAPVGTGLDRLDGTIVFPVGIQKLDPTGYGEIAPPADSILSYTYPFSRLNSYEHTAFLTDYFRKLTWTRDRIRAVADLLDSVDDDAPHPLWWGPQLSGHEAEPGATTWTVGSTYDFARPTLEQMRVEAWTAIAEGADGILWYPDCTNPPCGVADPGWSSLAAPSASEARGPGPLPLTVGEQMLEVSAELRVHSRAIVGTLVEMDLTDDGELDPWELNRASPDLGTAVFNPSGLIPVSTDNDQAPYDINEVDTDGDGLVDEPRKQDASAALFLNIQPEEPPGYYVVVTNLAECTKFVSTEPGSASLPVPDPADTEVFSLVQTVNTGLLGGLATDWITPCKGNQDIEPLAPETTPGPSNYFYGPSGDWASWQGTGGLFHGMPNTVTVHSGLLPGNTILCRSLVAEDAGMASDTMDWFAGGAWQEYAVTAAPGGGVDFELPMQPYDVQICWQDANTEPVAPWSPISTLNPYPSTRFGWDLMAWTRADPTVKNDPADAEIVAMCDRLDAPGVEPCGGVGWEWLPPDAEHPGARACTDCSDPAGVDDAGDWWVWIPDPGSGYPQRDFTHITSGTLCLDLEHVYDPGSDVVGTATTWDRASVAVSSANGCDILGHGAPSSSCTEPLTTIDEWTLQEAGSSAPRHEAVDLSAYLGLPFSLAMRYEATEDGTRTAGPGWAVSRAQLRWYEDETSTCEALIGL